MSRDLTRTPERSEMADEAGQPSETGRHLETTAEDSDSRPDADGGFAGRVGARAGRLLSARAVLAALLATASGLVVGTAVVPLPGAGLVGIFAATFLFGLVSEDRRYLETTVAGGVTFAASSLVGYAVVAALGGFGLPLVAVAGGVGALVGAVGHYFGRDLRDGLTREL